MSELPKEIENALTELVRAATGRGFSLAECCDADVLANDAKNIRQRKENLRALLAPLVADAERLDWMEDHLPGCSRPLSIMGEDDAGYEWGVQIGYDGWARGKYAVGGSLRAAIDAARGAANA